MKNNHIIIIGAGIIGCACAHRLLEAGFRVTLLEKSSPGMEASTAAAGILGAQSEVSGPGPFQELCLASRALFPDYVRELTNLTGMDLAYVDAGVLEVALDPGEGRLAVGRASWMLDRGLRVEILSREEARRLEPSLTPNMVGANFYPDDHQLDPNRLSRALVAAVDRLGGVFRTGEQAIHLKLEDVVGESEKRVTGVVTQTDLLPADYVIVAAGAWSSSIDSLCRSGVRSMVKPIHGEMIQADMQPPGLHHTVYGFRGYMVPRPDGEVVMGSTLEERGFDKRVTVGGLQRITEMALALVPAFQTLPITASWSGLRPATEDNLPLLGFVRSVKGVVMATGHYRNGILLAPITAEIIRDLLLDRPSRLKIATFAP